MPTITTKDGVSIFYRDLGEGQPIVFHHGWPLSADDWDAQMMFFLQHGFRVIAHDRQVMTHGALVGRLLLSFGPVRTSQLSLAQALAGGGIGNEIGLPLIAQRRAGRHLGRPHLPR